ncbi:FAD-dependent oxidoreductase [Catenulispora sp. EB89]|uniref:FAD-dependent oxidoreductase n=1 Tax=Catenulispora sp. EB89 TaxID=3156257 RepID=UPI0035124485
MSERDLDPAALDPAALDPAALDPAAVDPAFLDPAVPDPVALDPAALDPAALDPAAPEDVSLGDPGHLGTFDLAVIGAGPAGMAAAATAAEHGLRVALIDAGRQLGGQYFRHPAPGLTAPWLPKLYHGWQQFEQLVTRVETASGIEVLFGHQVWAIDRLTDPGFRVLTDRGPIEAPYVILATGAYERVVPFPGWDLPGVFTAGGAQALLKGNLVLPGRRVVVAGTGPLLLPVATGLATAGAKVLGLYEANNIRGYAKNPLPLITNPTKLTEGLDYARQLTRARITVHTGRMIIEAQGTDTLEAVVAARPDGTDPQHIPCDTLAIGYGLAPQIDLALTLGAAPTHLTDGTIALRVNTTQRTTIPGLYAAGETAGVAGAETALLEGEIAGLAVAQAAARARRVADRAAGLSVDGSEATPGTDTPSAAETTPGPAAPPSPSSDAEPSRAEPKPAGPIASRMLGSARAQLTRRVSPNPDTSATAASNPPAATGLPTAGLRAAAADPPAATGLPAAGLRAATGPPAATGLPAAGLRAAANAPAEPKPAGGPLTSARARFSRRSSSSPETAAASSSLPVEAKPARGGPLSAARARVARRNSPAPEAPAAESTTATPPPNLPTLLRRRARQRALADLLRARHPIPAAWRAHLADDTVVCRCEEVTASAITEAVTDLGAGDARTVKLLTRAGMGWCQGRVCGYAVACLARADGGADAADPASPSATDLLAAAKRPLARPVPLGVLAEQDRRNK